MNCGTTSIGLLLLALFGFLVVPAQVGGPFDDIAGSLDPSVAMAPPPAVAVEQAPVGVSCDRFPVYCVPFAEANADAPMSGETVDTRVLDMASTGAPGVVRGITDEGAYFLGDPAAPIHFKVFHNFGCPHCRDLMNGDLGQFIASHVVTGQATLEVMFLTFGAPTYPLDATYAAMCAGDQGAFWEMEATLFSQMPQVPLDQMVEFGAGLGLDASALRECIISGRHANTVNIHAITAADYGVAATPTVLVSMNGGAWEPVNNRSYDNLMTLTIAAHDQ